MKGILMSMEAYNSKGNIETSKEASKWNMDDVQTPRFESSQQMEQPVESYEKHQQKLEESRAAVIEAADNNLEKNTMINEATDSTLSNLGEQATIGDALNTTREAREQYEQGYSVYIPDRVADDIAGVDAVRRKKLEENPDIIYQILEQGNIKARQFAEKTMNIVRERMGL